MQPAYFIAHGAPDLVLKNNDYTAFLRALGRKAEKPQGIVIFTAHWESEILTVSYSDETYATIHDFARFPQALYSMEYGAEGSTEIADRMLKRLSDHDIRAERDANRGLDHGSWTVLKLMFPDADIPVVQASVNPFLKPEEQYRIGAAIKALRNEGVMIIGSGGTVHNLRKLDWGQGEPEPWAIAFDDWIWEAIARWDTDRLFRYGSEAPHAREAVPRPEHFVPLLIAMGAGDDRRSPERLFRRYDYATLSHTCIRF